MSLLKTVQGRCHHPETKHFHAKKKKKSLPNVLPCDTMTVLTCMHTTLLSKGPDNTLFL